MLPLFLRNIDSIFKLKNRSDRLRRCLCMRLLHSRFSKSRLSENKVLSMLRGIPLLENRKVCRTYQMSISCFLIDMKFVSRISEILLNHFSLFPRSSSSENLINNEVLEISKEGENTIRRISKKRKTDSRICKCNIVSKMPQGFLLILLRVLVSPNISNVGVGAW